MNVMETIRTMETMNTEKQEMTFEEVHELVKKMSLPQAKPREGALMMTYFNGKSNKTCRGSVAVITSMLFATMNENELFARTVIAVASRYLYEQESDKSDKDNKNNENNE